jgi:hypothetical protein
MNLDYRTHFVALRNHDKMPLLRPHYGGRRHSSLHNFLNRGTIDWFLGNVSGENRLCNIASVFGKLRNHLISSQRWLTQTSINGNHLVANLQSNSQDFP